MAKANDLPPPQQNPTDSHFAVGGRKLLAVVGGGIEIGHHLVRIQSGDGFRGRIPVGKRLGATAIRPKAGEQVRRDDDEALSGKFIGHLFGPVAEAEDLVDENDDGSFVLDLGIDDEGLQAAVAVLESDVLVMSRRSIEPGLGPVLSLG